MDFVATSAHGFLGTRLFNRVLLTTLAALIALAWSSVTFASQSESECPPGQKPGPSGCAFPQPTVTAETRGVGEWPSGLFVDWTSGYATVVDRDSFSSAFFDANDGQNDGTDAKVECGLGNPIIPSTGNKIEPETDFVTPGEVPLFLKRTYNRYWAYKGLFGYYWVSNFDLRIQKSPDGQLITAYRTDGRKIEYRYQATPTEGWYETKAEAVSKIVGDGAGGYILYGEDDSVETYNVSGQITSLKNQQGIGITFTYVGGKMYRATHTSGRYVQFGWTGDFVTSVTDPAGNVYQFGYSPSQIDPNFLLLGSVVRPASPSPATTITYHYETTWTPGNLTGKSYNGVRYSTFAYDTYSRATLSEHVGGADRNTFVYSWGSAGELITEHTNPLGKKTTYRYLNGKLQAVAGTPSTYCPSTYRDVTYDANGYADQVADFEGNKTDYDYNAKGQVTKKVEAFGTSAARETQYVWDSVKNRVTRETVTGLSQTDYTYLANSRLSSIKVTNLSANGVSGQSHTTTYSYTTHPNGMLATSTADGPLAGSQDAITQSFDALGNLTSTQNGLGHQVTYSNFNGMGLPGRVTGINGAIIDFTYDARGNVLTKKDYVGAATATTTHTYDNRGRLAATVTADGVATSFTYDGNNRLMQMTQPESHSAYASLGSNIVAFQRLTHNANSDVTKSEIGIQYIASGSGAVAPGSSEPTNAATTEGMVEPMACFPQPDCEPDPDPEPTISELVTFREFVDYDELGRVRAKRGNNGQNVRFTYDDNGNVATVTDSLGRTTTFTYDALDRAIKSVDAKLGITEFKYDLGDRLVEVKDPRSLITSYTYDGFGQMWAQSSPDTGTTTYQYDVAGQRTLMTRNDGSWLSYGYDGLGRLTWYGNSGTNGRGYSYDTCTNGKGKLCSFSSAPDGAWTSLHYTPQGQLASRYDYTYGIGDLTGYAYDGMGRLTGVSYPSGVSVGYGYVDGRLTTMTSTVGGVTTTVASNANYQPFGPVTSWTYGNGLWRQNNFDTDGRLTGISTNASGGPLQSLTYAFNANDLITAVTNGVSAPNSHTYQYDELSRLTSDTLGSTTNLADSFDAVGNRISRVRTDAGLPPTTNQYPIEATSSRMTGISGGVNSSYSYDSVGNLVSASGWPSNRNYTYGAFNRMQSVTVNGVMTTYAINALDQRVGKTTTAGTTRFVYGGQNQLLAEAGPSGWKSYLWLNGELVGVVLPNNSLNFVHTDNLGRPELVTNAAKQSAWSATNQSYGRGVITDQIGGLNLGFPGQYWDSETLTWYNGFRDYDPYTGRYIQSDPIGLAGGLNTYAYVSGNPVNLIDPTGLDWGYSQGAHTLTYINNQTGERTTVDTTGYAGHGAGVNNPSMQHVPNTGPLPQGSYTIGPQYNSPNTGRATMALTPAPGNNMFGRSLFRIHGDNNRGDQSASEGCIVIPRAVRDAINNSGDNVLRVVP